MNKIFSVWVGGAEANDYYLTRDEAMMLADEYVDDGYDDVYIAEMNIDADNVVKFVKAD